MRVFFNSHKLLVLRTRCPERRCWCGPHCTRYLKGCDRTFHYPVIPLLSSRTFAGDWGQKYYQERYAGRGRICEMQLLGLSHSSWHIPNRIISTRTLHIGVHLHDKEPLKPSSKVEQTVKALKKDLLVSETQVAAPPPVKKTMRQKIVDELLHYYHGFRLLFIDLNVSRRLIWRVLNGKSLTRREHRLLVRTVSDLFRLVPFSVFIIVPFMEFLLPVVIKFFPGMLPSTFQTATDKEAKLKQSLKVKLEMAKFLQQTLDDMAVQKKGRTSDSAKEFMEFFVKVRTSGEQASTEEIMRFSKLFEDEITLDSLRRPQLVALCRVLEMQTLGTNNFLRFQLRMKLRNLAADDKMIQKEGIDSLNPAELQQACRARGMRAYGISEARLKSQLAQWLDLSLNERVPPSLLLLSRALLLPETIPASDQLKATISVLPDTVVTQAKAAIGEREGVIDNKTKIEVIREEVRLIKEERQEMREHKRETEKTEILVDHAPNISDQDTSTIVVQTGDAPKRKELTSTDLETLEDALDSVGKERKKLLVEKEELDDLKEELADYQEDVDDLKEVLSAAGDKKVQIKESKGAKRLFKKVSSMISKMDDVLAQLEREEQQLKKDLEKTAEPVESKQKSEELVSIEELINAIKQLQKVPDESLVDRISEMLAKIDIDHDGALRVEDVLKVIEVVGKENVQLSQKQMDEIIELMSKEEIIELEEQIEKVLEKETLKKSVVNKGQTSKGVDHASDKVTADAATVATSPSVSKPVSHSDK